MSSEGIQHVFKAAKIKIADIYQVLTKCHKHFTTINAQSI